MEEAATLVARLSAAFGPCCAVTPGGLLLARRLTEVKERRGRLEERLRALVGGAPSRALEGAAQALLAALVPARAVWAEAEALRRRGEALGAAWREITVKLSPEAQGSRLVQTVLPGRVEEAAGLLCGKRPWPEVKARALRESLAELGRVAPLTVLCAFADGLQVEVLELHAQGLLRLPARRVEAEGAVSSAALAGWKEAAARLDALASEARRREQRLERPDDLQRATAAWERVTQVSRQLEGAAQSIAWRLEEARRALELAGQSAEVVLPAASRAETERLRAALEELSSSPEAGRLGRVKRLLLEISRHVTLEEERRVDRMARLAVAADLRDYAALSRASPQVTAKAREIAGRVGDLVNVPELKWVEARQAFLLLLLEEG